MAACCLANVHEGRTNRARIGKKHVRDLRKGAKFEYF